MMNYDYDDSGSLGYCSDPQFSPEHNITWNLPDPNSATWVEFTEQPADYRYRYLKEKYHGHIVGVSSPNTKKKDLCKFPKLKLNNYSGSAIVRVWLISTQLDRPRAHFHKLARKPPKGVLNLEPHDFRACEENNYEVTLDYLHIVHAVSNDEKDIEVYRKKRAHIDSDLFDPPISIPPSSKDEKEEIKQIDKNQSLFYIQVFDEKTRTKICQSIVSDKIKNLHNAETGALKIVNCSRTFGTCRGNDEVFIFVEKISKDVQVRFFRLNEKKERIWQALAIYGPQHVHHQLGIVFRTPKFDQNIEQDTQVFFELHRTNDGAISDPYEFTYKPHKDYKCNDIAKKRPHSPEIMSSEDEYVPTMVSSYNSSKRIKDESMSPDSTTLPTSIQPDPIIYSPYIQNDISQPLNIYEDFTSILNPSDSIDVNSWSLSLTEGSFPLSDVSFPLTSELLQFQFDSVSSSTDDVSDEDTKKPHCAEAEGPKPTISMKPLCAEAQGPKPTISRKLVCAEAEGPKPTISMKPLCAEAEMANPTISMKPLCAEAQGPKPTISMKPPCVRAQGPKLTISMESLCGEAEMAKPTISLKSLRGEAATIIKHIAYFSANADNENDKEKSRRKSSQTMKDLLSAISLKKPIEEFTEVLKNTVNVNIVDYEGNSALHYAVRASEYLEPILERDDIDRKLKNLWGDDALLDATRNNKIDIVKILLERDFDPNVQNSRTGETPLHLAVSNENCLMAELLLEYGADPLLNNYQDKSAYKYSMDCNDKLRRIMQFLMQKRMFQSRKSACLKEASCAPESDLVSKLNELTV